ncbi:pfkB family carbohydrate kinase [Roseivivax lentus]|uniref:PfkB family carbohydrate kinase n=1 Tax=Roseivivax lentus TaxID=633194 RepID=A0A1N7P4I7_9RHOB|nr:pfkB family carbohydrate kinase [Roseivivax lentus]
MNLPGDSRTFFHHPGANALLDASSFDIESLADRNFKVLYLGYLTLLDKLDVMCPDGRTAAAHLLSHTRAHGIVTCVDLASFKSPTYRDTVEATLPEIDILFANELEAELATGVQLAGEADVDGMIRAARILKSGGIGMGVIVHSPARVVWCGHGGEHVLTPEPIPTERVISAVGAGDAFAAGVIHGIHEDWPIESSLIFGTRAAAACLTGYTATDGLKDLSVPASPPS